MIQNPKLGRRVRVVGMAQERHPGDAKSWNGHKGTVTAIVRNYDRGIPNPDMIEVTLDVPPKNTTISVPPDNLEYVPALHKSQVAMHERCPRQFFYRYCEGLVRPPAVAMLIGTGVHVSAAKDLTSKRDTGELLPLAAVKEAAFDAINAEWSKPEGVQLDDEERLLGEKLVWGEAVDSAVSLATLHHGQLAPMLKPKHIERPFTAPLKDRPFDLGGTIDLQEDDGTLRDLKTRAASPLAGLADSNLDLTFYGLAAWSLDGQPPKSLALDCLVKTKTPKLVTLTTTRSKAEYNALLLRVDLINKAIESGVFPPCSPEAWCCSKKFCGYWTICEFGERGRV